MEHIQMQISYLRTNDEKILTGCQTVSYSAIQKLLAVALFPTVFFDSLQQLILKEVDFYIDLGQNKGYKATGYRKDKTSGIGEAR